MASSNNIKKYFLLLGDIVILYGSLWITLWFRYGSDFNQDLWNKHLLPFSIIFLIWLVIFYIDDLYDIGYGFGFGSLLNRLLRGSVIAALMAVFFFYLTSDRFFTIKPQRVLLYTVVIAFIALYIWRLFFNTLVRSPRRADGILLIGYNALAQEIIDKLKHSPQLGLQLKGILIDTASTQIPEAAATYCITKPFSELKAVCLEKKISMIVSTIHPRQNADLLNSLFDCISLNIAFFDITNFYETITGKIPVTTIEQIWFLENLNERNKNLYERLKFVLDVLVACILFIIALPFIPLIALAIKVTSTGPIFFIQPRVGKDGKIFNVIKFRTMVVGAEKNGPQWATTNDARVTPLGRIMRKTRIDEIPQLINVMLGEMSLIGPRPERPEFVEQLQAQIPFYTERLLVKPGLTGWAQVAGPAYGGSKEESLEKLQYDLFYIKNRSIGLDISILLKTIRIVLSRRGH